MQAEADCSFNDKLNYLYSHKQCNSFSKNIEAID